MKKLLSTFALISFLCLNFLGMTSASFADEATSVKAADAVTLVADATPAENLLKQKKMSLLHRFLTKVILHG